MALILRDGDYVPDGTGGLKTASGAQEILERILWKLSVRRGSFPFLPDLGSRLHQLGRAAPLQRKTLAKQYVLEALADENVTLTDLSFTPKKNGADLTVYLTWKGQNLSTTFALEGIF